MQVASPLIPEQLTSGKQSVTKATSASEFALILDSDIMSLWDTWLRKCKCHPVHPNPICGVHQLTVACTDYTASVEVEWRKLQEALQSLSPAGFTMQSEARVYGRIGLRLPGT